MKNIFLFSLYLIGILALVPIGRYVLYFIIGNSTFVEDKFITERIFLSSRILIIISLVLFFLYKKVHRISGILFFMIGILWLLYLFRDILSES